MFFFFSSRRRHTRYWRDWSSDVCSSDLQPYDFGAQTAGTPTLLFFGFTNCPDICPTTMADVAVALRGVDPALAEDVQVVFVTTDPAFDTPEVLTEYLGRFDADLPARLDRKSTRLNSSHANISYAVF